MSLDYLWRFPPYIILLIMVDIVSVFFPGVSYPPVYGRLSVKYFIKYGRLGNQFVLSEKIFFG